MKTYKHIFTAILALVAVSSCNKDEVIEPEVPDNGFRPATSASSPDQTVVYEYLPAPGQFINEAESGFSSSVNTPDAACAYALERLKARRYVSLGSFGGYIVVGFDHSIKATGGYEFGIEGNAFDLSNEPGIVWVMQDANGNGQPDDTWYQLKGSEYGKPDSKQDFSVTYYRPAEVGQPVEWKDSEGNTGKVDYIAGTHTQDSYYPAWVSTDSYTLTGTCLKAQNQKDTNGKWVSLPYAWGYADNVGSDDLAGNAQDGAGQVTGFKIANAVTSDGRPANLPYIDFVKVQTGVLAKSGYLGEISTEVFSVMDLSLLIE